MHTRLFAIAALAALVSGCGGGHLTPPAGTTAGVTRATAAGSTASNTAQSIDVYVNPQDLIVDQTTNEVFKFNLDGHGNAPSPTAESAYTNAWDGSAPACSPSPCGASAPAAPQASWNTHGAGGIFDTTSNAQLPNGTSVAGAIADEACKFWNGDALDSFRYQQNATVTVGTGRNRTTYTFTYTYNVTPNGAAAAPRFAWYLLTSQTTTDGNTTLQLDGYISGESVVFNSKTTPSCNPSVNSAVSGSYCYRVSFSMDTASTGDSGTCPDGTPDGGTRVCDLTANIYADDGSGNPAGSPVLTLSQNSADPSTLITVGPVNYNSTNGTDANGNPNFTYAPNAGEYYGDGGNPVAAAGNLALLTYGGSSTAPFDAGQAENGSVPDGQGDLDDFAGNDNYGIQTAPFSSPQFTLPSGDYIGVLTGTVKSNSIVSGNIAGLTFSISQHVRIHLVDSDGKCAL